MCLSGPAKSWTTCQSTSSETSPLSSTSKPVTVRASVTIEDSIRDPRALVHRGEEIASASNLQRSHRHGDVAADQKALNAPAPCVVIAAKSDPAARATSRISCALSEGRSSLEPKELSCLSVRGSHSWTGDPDRLRSRHASRVQHTRETERGPDGLRANSAIRSCRSRC